VLANGTQARYAAVRGVRSARARAGSHVLHSSVEHSATLHAAAEGPASAAGVDRLGRLDLDSWTQSVQPDTVLGCLTAASPEVGTRQPVADAAAALGPVPLLVDLEGVLGVDAVPPACAFGIASGHVWGGPPLGLLVVRTGSRWLSPWPEEETGSLGRVDVPALLATAVALRTALADQAAYAERTRRLVERLREGLAAVPDCDVVGDPVDRLPHVLSASFLYVEGEALVLALDRHGFAVASGSACSSSSLTPSHVLAAMGALTHGNLRLSLGPEVTDADVERFLAVLPVEVARLRAEAGV
jgi:cysteine desulfurase